MRREHTPPPIDFRDGSHKNQVEGPIQIRSTAQLPVLWGSPFSGKGIRFPPARTRVSQLLTA